MKVSVLITTYNHEKIIAQAIESVLAQATGFEYEIVIGEDCSTDRTRSICRTYQDRYPHRIRLLCREENLGLMENFPRTFLACHGQYVACLDGDDYWTSPDKLQRQADYLDAHPDCSLCFHNAMMVWEDGSQGPVVHAPPGRRSTYYVQELFKHDFISTASVAMVRNHLVREFPDWYDTLPVPDWPFFILHGLHGKMGYLDETWSVYRQHSGGMYSRLPEEKQMEQNIGIVRTFREVLGPEWKGVLADALHSRCLTLALYYRRHGDRSRASEFARLASRESRAGWLGALYTRAKVSAYMHVPALAVLVRQCRTRLGIPRTMGPLHRPESGRPEPCPRAAPPDEVTSDRVGQSAP